MRDTENICQSPLFIIPNTCKEGQILSNPPVTIKRINRESETIETLALLENAYNVSYHLIANDIGECSFYLPQDDPKAGFLQQGNLVEITEYGESVGLFRIATLTQKKDKSGIITEVSAYHVIQTLADFVLFQVNQATGLQTQNVIQYVLNTPVAAGSSTPKQSDWVLDRCDFDLTIDYLFENVTLLEALMSIPKDWTTPYLWQYDTTSYPWKLSLIQPAEQPICEIRSKKNLVSLSLERDYRNLANRVYALGRGEGINQLNLVGAKDYEDPSQPDNGEYYVQDEASIAKYGLKEMIKVDRSVDHKSQLLLTAKSLLNDYKEIQPVIDVKAVELYGDSHERIDRYNVGDVCHLIDHELGMDMAGRILEVKKKDLTGKPWEADLVIGWRPNDLIKMLKKMQRTDRVNELNSQGASNIYSVNVCDNADRNNPVVMRFRLPDDLIYVNQLVLDVQVDKFRAYEQAVSGGGGATVGIDTRTTSGSGNLTTTGPSTLSTTYSSGGKGDTVESDRENPSNTYQYQYQGRTWETHTHWNRTSLPPSEMDVDELVANYEPRNVGYVEAGDQFIDLQKHDHPHTHRVMLKLHNHRMDHTHSVSDHTHKIWHQHTLPNHEHDLRYGIYEEPTLAVSGIRVIVDGDTARPIGITSLEEEGIDLIPYLRKTSDGRVDRGVHTVEFVPAPSNTQAGLCRISAQAFVACFIQSRGSYTTY